MWGIPPVCPWRDTIINERGCHQYCGGKPVGIISAVLVVSLNSTKLYWPGTVLAPTTVLMMVGALCVIAMALATRVPR